MLTGRPSYLIVGVLVVGLGLAGLGLTHGWSTVRDFQANADELVFRSAHVRAQAGPEYQEEALAALPPNPHNGPFYRLDEMLGEAEVGEEPPALSSDEHAAVLFGFEFEDPRPPLVARDGRTELAVGEDGILRVRHARGDWITNIDPMAVPGDEVGEILIRARTRSGSRMMLSWSPDPEPDTRPYRIALDLITDGEFHLYVIDAKNAIQRGIPPGDSIRRLSLQPTDVDGAIVEIDYLRIVSKRAKYLEHDRGVDYERVGGDLRRVMYMRPPQRLDYHIRIPEESPTLDFGTAALLEDRPVRFRVTLTDGARETTLYDHRVSTANRWNDARLDLSPWAGREVRLSLRTAGDGNVAFWSEPFVSSTPTERFNVILIVEDVLRADHLSTYGYARPTSPVKDSVWAESGIVFLNANSQATKTRPSVPSMMTGLLPTATGVWNFHDMLADEYLTMAEVLRSQGFVTGSFVQNANAGPGVGLHQGFGSLVDRATIGRATEELVGGRVTEWLERWEHRNFFLYLHIIAPHGTYDPPEPYDRWYHEEGPGETPVGEDGENYPYLDPDWVEHPTTEGRRLLYDGEVRNNDAQIGKLLARLDSLGLAENTLLVLTSDHGEYLGDYGLWEHKPPGLRPVIGVPLMFRHPSRLPESERVQPVVQLLDLKPTILEMAGVELGGLLLHGESLVDLIEGRRPEHWRDRVTISEEPMVMRKGELCECGSLFFRGWQLIASGELRGVPRGAYFRYRRAVDFREHQEERRASFRPLLNYLVKFRYGNVVKGIQANNFEAWRAFTGMEDEHVYRLDPDEVERLRALGYIN